MTVDRILIVTCGLVVVAVGLSAPMPSPRCDSIRSEAKVMLKSIYVAQAQHHGMQDTYVNALPNDSMLHRPNNVYTYVMRSASRHDFVAEAVGRGDMQGDTWRITRTGQAEHVIARCKKPLYDPRNAKH